MHNQNPVVMVDLLLYLVVWRHGYP